MAQRLERRARRDRSVGEDDVRQGREAHGPCSTVARAEWGAARVDLGERGVLQGSPKRRLRDARAGGQWKQLAETLAWPRTTFICGEVLKGT